MGKRNRYGLPRTIKESVKKQIRKNCGFGCVICGAGIYEYEHVDPEYSAAKVHDPAKMTLLCGQCHGKKTRGFLSKEAVIAAMQDPYCRKSGFAKERLDIGLKHPKVIFAGSVLNKCNIPVMAKGKKLIEIKSPRSKGESYLINADFNDSTGKRALTIKNNIWKATSDVWDMKCEGGKITIKENDKTHLILELQPPDTIAILKIDTKIDNVLIQGDTKNVTIIDETNNTKVVISKGMVNDAIIGFDFY